MADRVLFVGWGNPVRGREDQAVESFNDIVGLLGRMEQEGRIERFDTVFLDPHGGDLGGCFMVHCTTEQLHAVREDEEFQREMARAALIVDRLGTVGGYTGDAIARRMDLYKEATAKVPQLA
jgi:hypothetical protein